MRIGPPRRVGRKSQTPCLLAAAWLGCSLSAGAQSRPAPTPEPLAAGASVSSALAAGESRVFTLELAPGHSSTLSIEQTEGAVEVQWRRAGEVALPRTNPAGLHSSVTLILNDSDAVSEVEQISLRNLSTAKPAEVLIHAAAAHATSAQDRKQADAEAAFASAETTRIQKLTNGYAKALGAYDDAIADWRGLNDARDLARALAWKALFLFVNRNDAAGALPVVEEALRAAAQAPGISPTELANCHKIAGYVHVQLAQYDAGREQYKAAIAIFEQTNDLFNQEVLLDNLSRVERLQGNTDRALAAAWRAEALAAQIGDGVRQLKIESEIGAIELSASNLQAAYAAYQGALALLKTNPDPTTEGYVWSDLGVLYTTLREPQEARNALDRALEVWQQHPNPAGELNTLDDYGEFWLSQSKTAQARAFYQRGLVLARKESLARPEVFLLRGLGAAYLLEGDLAEAQRNLDQALALALKIEEGDGLPEIYCLLGDLNARKHDGSAAETAYGQCGASARSAKDAYNTIRADGSLARLRFEQGRAEDAEQLAEQALGGIEATRTSIPEQDLRTSFFASMRSYYELGVDILERLDQLHPGEGYQWSAFLTAERARARMLLDAVAEPVQPTGSSALAAEYADVEARLHRNQEALERLPTQGSGAKRQQIRDAIARLTVEDDALATELKGTPANDRPSIPLTLAALQASLPGAHSVFLEYWTSQRGSYLWAATQKDFKVFRLPPAPRLGAEAASFSRLVLAPSEQNPNLTAEDRARTIPAEEQALSRQAAGLRSVLFPAGAIPPRTVSLLIASDGPLDSISFTALLGSPVSGLTIIREPSATFLLALLSRSEVPHQPQRIAIFADTGERRSAANLPFVLEEVRTVQGIVGPSNSRVLSGADASPQAIESFAWDGFTIGHFAAHATLNRANLQLSGIDLQAAPGTSGYDASTLWYGDICRLHARLELVVLSACNTAAGQEIPGEGLVGLTQAFFTAGAQRVLGTLWAVDDEATAMLMRYFYTALQSSGSPAAALRVAQNRVAATERWRAPYYWAGFTLAGDWRPLP
jgi:tetratricopeptide (TPR) repeat protein